MALVIYGEKYVALLKCVLFKVRESHTCFPSARHNLLFVTAASSPLTHIGPGGTVCRLADHHELPEEECAKLVFLTQVIL